MELVNYGPDQTFINQGFNIQPCGNSAMWFELEGIDDFSNIVLIFDNHILKVFRNGNILTTLIPLSLLSQSKTILIEIFDEKDIENKINILFQIKQNEQNKPFEVTKKPNLFFIGFPRSGTTTLYWKFLEHESIFMSRIKEPHFFDSRAKGVLENIVTDWHQYEQLFRYAPYNVKYKGEATANYITSRDSMEKIYSFNSEAKVLLMIRNPIVSSISFFSMHKKGSLYEDEDSFDTAWENSIKNSKRTFLNRYSEIYKVGTHTQNAISVFGENLKIILFDDFVHDNNKVLNDIYDFLNIQRIDYNEVFDKTNSAQYNNISSIASKETLDKMIEYFTPEIQILEQILERDLSCWTDL